MPAFSPSYCMYVNLMPEPTQQKAESRKSRNIPEQLNEHRKTLSLNWLWYKKNKSSLLVFARHPNICNECIPNLNRNRERWKKSLLLNKSIEMFFFFSQCVPSSSGHLSVIKLLPPMALATGCHEAEHNEKPQSVCGGCAGRKLLPCSALTLGQASLCSPDHTS